ncbi:ATP-dependent RNA helicase [Thraustotheca clavata]|uniref:RNA helicase n=1 Tax=Thraustotheca clavata TaxID=74557 RepID=A0A1W0A1G1_9STRA|nr:ATP-dependent RNA helicase [Thraustotheca clavata]
MNLSEVAESRLSELLQPTLDENQFLHGLRTLKKIEKAYDILLGLELSLERIEKVLYHANDATSALEYLCLFYSSEELPATCRSNVPKAAMNESLQVIAAKATNEREIITPTPSKNQVKRNDDEEEKKKEEKNAKEWTKKYVEMQAYQENLEEESINASPEDKMWRLEVDCATFVAKAQQAKRLGTQASEWNVHVARLRREMRELEPYVDRNKMKALPPPPVLDEQDISSTEETNEEEATEDDEDGLFGMLENTIPAPSITPAIVAPTPIDTSSLSKWTGKTPRVQLQEYCRKMKWPPPQYTQENQWGKYNFSVKITQGTRSKASSTRTVILNDVIYLTMDGAKDAVATRALHELTPHLPLHRGLPPFFRDMWLDWEREKNAVAVEGKKQATESKAAIVQRLYKLRRPEINTQVIPQAKAPIEKNEIVLESWDDEVDDWEDMVADAPPTPVANTPNIIDNSLIQGYKQRMTSSKYQSFVPGRKELPIAAFQNEIVSSLQQHNVVLISGETGCGKSTQVPHYLLQEILLQGQSNGFVICTQPRRIAAIGVAERVAQEVGEDIGTSYVGYSIRLETKRSKDCKLLFCTTGILLRQLQTNPTLEGISHVIVDEIHERDVQCDVLLALLRRLVLSGSHIKVVLMSATLNAQAFQNYFNNCPIVNVPGRLFPVTINYLEDVLEMTQYIVHEGTPYCKQEDYQTHQTSVQISGRGRTSRRQILSWNTKNIATAAVSSDGQYSAQTLENLAKANASVINYELIEDLIVKIIAMPNHNGAILVFLSGRAEIRNLIDQLESNRKLNQACVCLPLHASLSTSEQHRIFANYPKQIKVIVSTNLAETSLTIDDVTVVIDAGRVKQMSHDVKTQTSCLKEVWISKANANQRAGRAGRVQAGVCYRMYPYETFEYKLNEQPVAEIHRAPLTSLVLQLHTLVPGSSVHQFWNELLESPPAQAIEDAVAELHHLGALTQAHALTPLGVHLSVLPLDVRVGKMILFSAIFQCPRPISIIAAILETKSPFVAPFGRDKDAKEKRLKFMDERFNSDLLTDLAAYQAWKKLPPNKQNSFCAANYLSRVALEEIQKLALSFEQMLIQLGFLPQEYHTKAFQEVNRYAETMPVVAAVVCAGLYPNVIEIEKDTMRFWEKKKQVFIHPTSINHQCKVFRSPWLGYHFKLQTSRVYVPLSSGITHFALALFAGEIVPDLLKSTLTVDGWITIASPGRTSMLVCQLRKCLNDLLQRIASRCISLFNFLYRQNRQPRDDASGCKCGAGRAGSVQAGVCYRVHPYDTFEYELNKPVSEIRRAPLTSLVLQLHTLVPGSSVHQFWNELLESPPAQAIQDAVAELHHLGTITQAHALTLLGVQFSVQSLDIFVGKMILFHAIFNALVRYPSLLPFYG